MMKLLLPVIMLLIGAGAGIGAGIAFKENPDDVASAPQEASDEEAETAKTSAAEEKDASATEFAKLGNQFVVPVVTEDEITSMVVLSLSIEVPEGQKDTVFAREPKLRDAFLAVLFNHANIGGFAGNFTSAENMRILRTDLQRAANSQLGDVARNVLILDLVRQDA